MNKKHGFQKDFIVFSHKSHVFSRKTRTPEVYHNLNDMGTLTRDATNDILVSELFIYLFVLEKYLL